MRKPILGQPSTMAVAIAVAFCVSQPAAAATLGPMVTVAVQGGSPTVAIGTQGNFVVGWLASDAHNPDGIGPAMVSPYAADGSPIGSAPITLGAESTLPPAVAMDADSDFVAAWVEVTRQQTNLGFKQPGKLYVQQYSANGSANGAPTPVSSTDDYFSQYILADWGSLTTAPQLAMDDSGDFDVAWGNFTYAGTCNLYGACGASSGTSKVYAASYRADGTALRGKTTVGKTSLSAITRPEFLMGLSRLGNGDVSFTAYGYVGNALSRQLLSPSLVKIGLKLALGDFRPDTVVATSSDGSGNMAVVSSNADTTCTVSRFNSLGAAIGSPIPLPVDTFSDCYRVSLAMNASGAFAVVWAINTYSSQGSSYGDLYGQYFNADGSANGASFAIRHGGETERVATALNASGGLAVAWSEDDVQGYPVYSVYARSISPQ